MNRTIITHPLNGGAECDTLYQLNPCTVDDICDSEPVPCEYSEWEVEVTCSCEDPFEYFFRTVI